uniref:Acyl carrier protein n=1 Tax=Pterocladiophila hemisphaerica TaxID=2712948 RepID=A0A6M3WW91_9FLOR|nr:acpP [Pterocladiophila hemisphaerica]
MLPENKEVIFQKLKKIISEQLNINKKLLLKETNFIKDLKADSLDIVEVFMAVEDIFKFKILDVDAKKLETIQDLIDYIYQKKKSI